MRLEQTIQAVDAHACGEPGRVIVGGVSDVPGATMYDKMVHLRDCGDNLRTGLRALFAFGVLVFVFAALCLAVLAS